jgi:hypothetical protein
MRSNGTPSSIEEIEIQGIYHWNSSGTSYTPIIISRKDMVSRALDAHFIYHHYLKVRSMSAIPSM